MAGKILTVENVEKIYPGTVAVDGVSFSVGSNEILGLLGPNGAGKTTIINMILGVLFPTKGRIAIHGIDITTDRQKAISLTNFAAVNTQVPGNLTVYQNLKVFGLIYTVKNLEKKIEEVIQHFELEKFRNTRCGLLSSGEQTRVHLAKALLNDPRLLLLDEPTASLDPSSARMVREKIKQFTKDTKSAALITSHNMHEVSEICDRVLFLSHGKILLEGDPKTLPAQHGKENLEELFITVAREPLSLDV